MLHDPINRVVGWISGLTLGALATDALARGDVGLLGFIVAALSAFGAFLVGIRHFVRSEIRLHADAEDQLDRVRHSQVLDAVGALAQRLEDRGVLPPSYPHPASGEWTMTTPGVPGKEGA